VCANITSAYHKLHHMRYHIYKRCEDKVKIPLSDHWLSQNTKIYQQVELLRDENPTLEPNAILDLCFKNRSWVSHVSFANNSRVIYKLNLLFQLVQEYLDLWKKVADNEF
jgi:hypothetical protein